MIRLLTIEWLKLKHYRPFWILIGMYVVVVTLICGGGMLFMEFLKQKGADFNGFDPTMLPIYDFPDIWQNMTYIASYFKIILAFIVIISIANESTYRIIRQNIIDGLSKKEWLFSKLLFITVIALGATLLLFFTALVMGLIYSHPDGLPYMFASLDFLGAYFLSIITFLTFALLLILLIRKAGLVIVGLFLYTLIFEPFLTLFLENFPHISEHYRLLVPYFPIKALRELIPFPYARYALMEIQDYVGLKETIIVVGWLLFNIAMSYLLLMKKDW